MPHLYILVASGEKLGFQITLLLSSYIYFDVFQDMLPPFEVTGDTPAALIFFIILIVIQFFTIIGTDFIRFPIISKFKIPKKVQYDSNTVKSIKSEFMGTTSGDK